MNRKYRAHKSKMRKKVISNIIFILFIAGSVVFLYLSRVFPALSISAESYLNTEMNKMVTNAALNYLEQTGFESYVDITYTNDNTVSGINARVNAINEARLLISREILSQTNSSGIKIISLPLGCIFSNNLLYARGPKLKFRVISSDKFVSKVESVFIERGINQTLFELYITFKLEVTVSMPLKAVNVPVTASYLICETVIVGDVPEAYTDINRTFDDITESEIDDINDFGAEL